MIRQLDVSSLGYRVMGIDPGTSTYGMTIIDVMPDGTRHVMFAETFNAMRHINQYSMHQGDEMMHGNRFARLHALSEYTNSMIAQYGPRYVAYESAFAQRRFINAFAALTECLTTILCGINSQYPYLPFIKISPQEGKAAVRVTGKGSQKEAVAIGVRRRKDIVFKIDTSQLDEHSWDSIAVALASIDQLEDL